MREWQSWEAIQELRVSRYFPFSECVLLHSSAERDYVIPLMDALRRRHESPIHRVAGAPAGLPTRATPSGSALSGRWRARVLPLLHWVIDSGTWVLAIPFANLVRRDFDLERITEGLWWVPLAVAAGTQGISGLATGLYRRWWRYGSFEEVVALSGTVVATTLFLLTLSVVTNSQFLPVSIPLVAGGLVLLALVAARSVWRLRQQRRARTAGAEAILVVGAGEGGYNITRHLLEDPYATYVPVGLLDDDPLKAKLRVRHVKVLGPVDDLAVVARRTGARTVLLAVPSAGREFLSRVKGLCDAADLPLVVLPPVAELFGHPVGADIRPVSEADLLGRRQVELDPAVVRRYISGRRVLVTGAGGSIGSELCRQLAQLSPARLMMLDRDESGLHAVQLSIEGRALLDSPDLFLADLRDAERIDQLLAEHQPEVIFHAAALKHLTLLEENPAEAWKTNVVGTAQLLESAIRHGVTRFVNISTDKAADPISVLGYSKRITERLTAAAGDTHARRDHLWASDLTRYLSVRFGNVLGSRGSVLTVFDAQAAAGGPITLTHADVTRYFMTIAEAVRLTLHAGAIGDNGEVLVLDMGTPVRIGDVAARFAQRSVPAVPIVQTGLRPGEKLHEVLLGADEADVRPVHPLISHVSVPRLSFADCVATMDYAMCRDVDLAGVLAQLATAHDARVSAGAVPPLPPDVTGPATAATGVWAR